MELITGGLGIKAAELSVRSVSEVEDCFVFLLFEGSLELRL